MPQGLVEDVIVEVGHLVFPIDFVVLDMEEDARVPIIVGMSFLAISHTIMDMREGKLTLRVREDELVVKIFSLKKEQDTLELRKGSKEEVEILKPKVLESMIPLDAEEKSFVEKGI